MERIKEETKKVLLIWDFFSSQYGGLWKNRLEDPTEQKYLSNIWKKTVANISYERVQKALDVMLEGEHPYLKFPPNSMQFASLAKGIYMEPTMALLALPAYFPPTPEEREEIHKYQHLIAAMGAKLSRVKNLEQLQNLIRNNETSNELEMVLEFGRKHCIICKQGEKNV